MRYYKALLFFLLIFLTLTGCRQVEEFTSIPADRHLAITVNIKDMSLSFVDIEKQTPIASWQVNKAYTGGNMLADGDTLLLFGEKLNTIDLYSLSRGKLIHQWTIGEGIVDVEVLSDNHIAVLDEKRNSVRFFTNKGEEKNQIEIFDQPLEMKHDENKETLFIIGFDDNILSTIDLDKMVLTESYDIHSHATGMLVLDDEIWLGGHGEGIDIEKNVHVYDQDTGKERRKIALPSMPVAFTVVGDAIFVVSHGSNQVYKVTQAGEILADMNVTANPFTIETVDQGLLMVAGYDSSELQFIDSESMEIKSTIEVGEGPFQILLRENEDS